MYGADPTVRNIDGKSPLDAGASQLVNEVVKKTIQHCDNYKLLTAQQVRALKFIFADQDKDRDGFLTLDDCVRFNRFMDADISEATALDDAKAYMAAVDFDKNEKVKEKKCCSMVVN